MKSLFAELKRRNVYKVAVAYAVVAWLLIQAGSILFPTFEAPAWVMKVFVTIVAAGFPVALVLAWAFEVTPEGIKRAEDVSPHESIARRTGRKIVATTIVLALIAAGLLAFQLLRPKPAAMRPVAATSAVTEKSIAVLPFANLSEDKANAYFAEGIQDEILTRLSKIADLKVISRTSTLRYQGAPNNLREIAQQLDVANILEGSVQKAGGQVRVTVQLINALNDSHLWAETFDRNLLDVFQVESDVAQKIAGSLEAKLTGREKKAIETVGTKVPEAYDAYLRARALQNKQALADRERLIEFCHEAVKLDPNFVEAWAYLATAESEMYFGDIHTKERFERARVAAETALRLGPELAEAHAAMGLFYYYCLQDFDRALQELEFAHERRPNEYLMEIAIVHRRQGRLDQSIKEMLEAVQVDPRNEDTWVNLGRSYRGKRDFAEARKMFDRALEIAPGEESIVGQRAETFLAEGNLEGAKEAMHAIEFAPSEGALRAQATILFYERRFDEVLTMAEGLLATQKLAPTLIAQIHAGMAGAQLSKGETALAQPLYEQAERELLNVRASGDESLWLADTLIEVQAHLGKRTEVEHEAESLIAQTQKDQWRYPITETVLARAYVALGDIDRALPLLTHALSVPADTSITVADLRLDPAWDSARDDPRFQKLVDGR